MDTVHLHWFLRQSIPLNLITKEGRINLNLQACHLVVEEEAEEELEHFISYQPFVVG